MPARFALRAVELHGRRMWERAAIVRTLAFMRAHDLDTLVLHESDIVHQIVYPRAYFDPYTLWSDMPSRRGENAIFNNRAYMQDLLRLAAEAGIAVYLNVKEIGFSDEVLALQPQLFKDGAFCPSEPFWRDYVGHKTDELFTDFPGLAGLIVSFGSQESRASRVQNRCKCQLCRDTSLQDWYGAMIACIHAPVVRHGKRLAIRDFAYKPADHAPLIAAMERAPEDVVFCIKAMPHDFYLTFPDNPALGRLAREQWVEYDVLGQFFGWGAMPCFVFDDLAARMPRWQAAGASGAIFRIEWERLNDLDSFDNISEANLIAAALLAAGEATAPQTAVQRWLEARNLDTGAAEWLTAILARTPAIMTGAAYTAGFVTADNSMLPRSVERAWWGAEVRDALIPWDASRAGALDLTCARLTSYLTEKNDALAAAQALCTDIANGCATLDGSTADAITRAFAHLVMWVDGQRLCVSVCLYARWFTTPGADVTTADLAAMARLLDQLKQFADRAQAFVAHEATSHHLRMLIDPLRAHDVLRDGRAAHVAAAAKAGIEASTPA